MPIENRSSNNDKVSVPPFIGREPLVGRYYPAECRRCGWVGSSEELTEDDAQCTRDVGDRLCLGDCDELERHDLLNIIQAMARSAEQQQGEPVALPARKPDPTEESDVFTDAENSGFNAYLGEIAKLGPLFNRPVQGESIQLTAVATLVDAGDLGLEASWLLEGGTAELHAGMTLLVAEKRP